MILVPGSPDSHLAFKSLVHGSTAPRVLEVLVQAPRKVYSVIKESLSESRRRETGRETNWTT